MEIAFPTALVTVVCLIISIYFIRKKKSKKLPPGPRGWPIIGNTLQIPTNLPIYKSFTPWAEKYGPIYTIKLGFDTAIVLNDAKLIREAFNNPALNGRPNDKVSQAIAGGQFGVIGTDGEIWTEQRRFSLRHLRDFGFGKTSMESLILDEAKEVLENFHQEGSDGKAFDPSRRFNLAVLNSLWFIVTGSRFNLDDHQVQNTLEAYFREIDNAFVSGYLSLFPVLADIAPEWSGFNRLLRVMKETSDFFMGVVSEHQKTMEEGEPRDYIDAYLGQIKKAEGQQHSSFHEEKGYKNLLAIMGDFFSAGGETTSTTLSWAVLYLAVHVDVQENLQKEIDNVIGRSRCPSLEDRSKMPYTEAVMNEVFRKSSILSIGLFHRATEDTTLGGYDIPKNCWIVPHTHRVHHNPDTWEDPFKFLPERFLAPDGDGRVNKTENLMPFSVGKRACLGESLARNQFFLFLTTIYQHLDIRLHPDSEVPSLEPQNTFVNKPFPYKVVTEGRKS